MIEYILKISEIKRPERNVRIHTEQQLREFEKSIKMFGQIRPIVIDENNMILAGNGLYETLKRMGIEEAKVYKYENLSENQKKKLMIADNKIFSLGIENLDTLNEFLVELQGDLEIPGFDEEILKQMVADADEITEKISEYGTLDEDEIQHIKQANEKREKMELASNEVSEEKGQVDSTSNLQEKSTVQNNDEAIEMREENVREYIICPKCGEKIWL